MLRAPRASSSRTSAGLVSSGQVAIRCIRGRCRAGWSYRDLTDTLSELQRLRKFERRAYRLKSLPALRLTMDVVANSGNDRMVRSISFNRGLVITQRNSPGSSEKLNVALLKSDRTAVAANTKCAQPRAVR